LFYYYDDEVELGYCLAGDFEDTSRISDILDEKCETILELSQKEYKDMYEYNAIIAKKYGLDEGELWQGLEDWYSNLSDLDKKDFA